jgi:hypothetical protein
LKAKALLDRGLGRVVRRQGQGQAGQFRQVRRPRL